MDLDTLQPMRKKFFYQRKFRSCFYDSSQKQYRINRPVSRLIRKLLRRLQPVNELEDPCIAAVLIALAQEQYLAQKQLSGSGARSGPNNIGLNSHSNPMAGTIPASEETPSLPNNFKVHSPHHARRDSVDLCNQGSCLGDALHGGAAAISLHSVHPHQFPRQV
jgi:hypothetical protein